MLSSLFEVLQSEKVDLTSNWSVKHAAYVAGLGTFGLSRNLISKRGAAIRCGEIMQKSDAYDAAMPGCGLCQTAVPCEAGIPNRLK
jgi:hypothetical protein